MSILFDLHTHTVASGHAFSTLKENVEEAQRKGLLAIGTSDHSDAMTGSVNSNIFFGNYKVLKKYIKDVRIIKGIEANIMNYEGCLDVEDSLLEKMDYVIASLHRPCIKSGTVEQNTNAVIGAMENPFVKIIGHPDDDRYPLNYEKVVAMAKKHQVALELNNSSFRPSSGRINAEKNTEIMLKLCKEHNVKILMSSDAHIYYDVGNMKDCIRIIEKVDFPKELVLNYSMENLRYIFNHEK